MSIKEYLEAKLKQAKQDLIDCEPEDEDYYTGVADATEVILNWVNKNKEL